VFGADRRSVLGEALTDDLISSFIPVHTGFLGEAQAAARKRERKKTMRRELLKLNQSCSDQQAIEGGNN
jgi:hypothetical protein